MRAMSLNFEPFTDGGIASSIAEQIRRMTMDGSLMSGHRLPSTRILAKELDVARGTVTAAVEALIAEGLLETRTGAGTFVTMEASPEIAQPERVLTVETRQQRIVPDVDPRFDGPLNFQPCRPSMEAFPKQKWRRAVSDTASQTPSIDYGDPQGEPALRRAIASYLCRARGMDVDASEIIVTNGALHAMNILAQLMLGPLDKVGFEEPGYPLARQVFSRYGAGLFSLQVDGDGAVCETLPERGGNVRLLYVTPSHQFPTGARLSLRRRQGLINWAARNGALIIEDDYDGEFRFDIAPLPPMAAMKGGQNVIYFGTFSKTLFPGLRVGFACGPADLIAEMAIHRATSDYQSGTIVQLALGKFIQSGEFEKHIMRMRRIYGRKRKALADAINLSASDLKLQGTESGLNGLIRLPAGVTATMVAKLARGKGVFINSVRRYCSPESCVSDDALVFGYSAVSEAQIIQGVACLAQIVRDYRQ